MDIHANAGSDNCVIGELPSHDERGAANEFPTTSGDVNSHRFVGWTPRSIVVSTSKNFDHSTERDLAVHSGSITVWREGSAGEA
jgi:hypothetical protein